MLVEDSLSSSIKVHTSGEFSNWDKNEALKSTGVAGVNIFVSGFEVVDPMLYSIFC